MKSRGDRRLLRELAREVAGIAASPRMQERRRLWIRHNALDQERPMLLVYPEDAWDELLPPASLEIEDPVLRTYEWYLRRLLYRAEKLDDDFVVSATVNVPLSFRNTGWGLEPKRRLTSRSTDGFRPDRGVSTPFSLMHEFCRVFSGRPSHGTYAIDPVLNEEEDLGRMRRPEIIVDEAETARIHDMVSDAVGDLLPVRVSRQVDLNLSLIGTINSLRGIEQVALDMLDRPRWLHDLLRFMTECTLALLDDCEERGLLDLNNAEHYVGSGGVGFTRELPRADFSGRVRLGDQWGFATMQSATFISPEMQAEFILPYQARLLERFGLNCYGCCEALTARNFAAVRSLVPRLRRVSVSPFTDRVAAAEFLGDKLIYSWKPNPAFAQAGRLDPDFVEQDVRSALRAARGRTVEIVLKDVVSVHGEPDRLTRWTGRVRGILESL